MEEKRHLYFADNLKIALTVLVIAHHVGQAYGPTGGYWLIQEDAREAILAPFFTVNRSFFMSLFFMISGYFMVISYDRHGPVKFLKSRFMRLGIPLLLFFFVIIPVEQYLCHLATGRLESMSFVDYYGRIYLGIGGIPAKTVAPFWPELNLAHLWYVEHLLIASVVYALFRIAWKGRCGLPHVPARPPRYWMVVVLALMLAVVSFVVRIWYPIDRWIGFLGFIQVAFADVPRDLSFFALGALAYRRRWFLETPVRTGYIWLAVGLIAGGLWYAYVMGLRNVFPINRTTMDVLYPIWEAFLCCGMCIGLLVLFRQRFDFQGPLGKAMAQGQYGAYLFHMPVVLLAQYAVLEAALPPLAKFLVVTAASVPLTFLLAHILRMPAWARKVL